MQSHYSALTVKGVIVSCSGDIRVLGADKFIPVDVPIFDPVFEADKSTSSEMIGAPVRVRKLPPHPAWENSAEQNIYENQEVTRLFRAMDSEQEDFGFAPMQWDLGVGSALVVRDDHTDITPQQVEVLCYYSWEHTTDMFQDASEQWEFTGSNEAVVKLAGLFSPEKFREFFAEFKAKKMVDDAGWVTAVSPV